MGRRRRVVAASLAGFFAMLTLVLGALSVDAAPQDSGPVTVRVGDVLDRDVTGFAADTPVAERLAGRTHTTALRSDADGVVHVAYRVPNQPGDYRLTLVGQPPDSAPQGQQPTPSGPSDQQVIAVAVPKLVTIELKVARPAGGLGIAGIHSGPRGHRGTGTGSGGLADTGVDIEALLELAGVVLAGGLIVAALGRQPRRPA